MSSFSLRDHKIGPFCTWVLIPLNGLRIRLITLSALWRPQYWRIIATWLFTHTALCDIRFGLLHSWKSQSVHSCAFGREGRGFSTHRHDMRLQRAYQVILPVSAVAQQVVDESCFLKIMRDSQFDARADFMA